MNEARTRSQPHRGGKHEQPTFLLLSVSELKKGEKHECVVMTYERVGYCNGAQATSYLVCASKTVSGSVHSQRRMMSVAGTVTII